MEGNETALSQPVDVSDHPFDQGDSDNKEIVDESEIDSISPPVVDTATPTKNGTNSDGNYQDATSRRKSLSPKIPRSPATPESKRIFNELKTRYLI